MANPQLGTNLHCTLVAASSNSTGAGSVSDRYGELNLPIGTTVATGLALQSANISIPSRAMTVVALVQMSSGAVLYTLDKTTDGTTPTFAGSGKDQFQATRNEPVFLSVTTSNPTLTNTNGVLTATTVNNVVALKALNNSGATLTLQAARLIAGVVFDNDTAWFGDNTEFMASAGIKDGTWTLRT